MIALPVKTHELHNHHMDSTMWNDFKFRDDDIIIATYAKSGTTWMQQIVSQLIFQGREGLPIAEMSPWVDLRVPPKEIKLPEIEAQTHRRFLKTHLPVGALVFSDKPKYLYIGRDGRDVMWSMHNHQINANEKLYESLNDTPGLVGPRMERPPASAAEFFEHWLDNNGAPYWPYWDNIQSWWEIRHLPNVMLVHFTNLKSDLRGQIELIAEFLEIDIAPGLMDDIELHCSFDYMKEHAAATVPRGGEFWDGGAKTFLHKGRNGRWQGELPADVSERYETRALQELGDDCANWLANGIAA